MAAKDTEMENSNEKNTTNACPGIKITPPPAITLPTTSSSQTIHEWRMMNRNSNTRHPLRLSWSTSTNLDNRPSGSRPSTSQSDRPEKLKFSRLRRRVRSESSNWISHHNYKMETKVSKLRYAASTCNLKLLNLALDDGANPNIGDQYRRSALHMACSRGYLEIIQQLMKFGANVNAVDAFGNTPIHLAVISSGTSTSTTAIEILLKAGARVHVKDGLGRTPLDYAKSKLEAIVKRNDKSTETTAMYQEMLTVVRLIIDHMIKQRESKNSMTDLEKSLEKMTTAEYQQQVSQLADEFLSSIENLSISK